MCGIVGAIRANHNVVDFLTDGLKRLEYRGYDSSGIAVNMDGKIKRVRRVGRVAGAASNRRTALVEHAVSTLMVTAEDLYMLDEEWAANQAPADQTAERSVSTAPVAQSSPSAPRR